MLRRRLSAGALRAAAQAQHSPSPAAVATASIHSNATPTRSGGVTPSSAAAKATITTPQQQSKSLASAVLLGTQRTWKTETVVTLKAELKRRGLSQSGNKSTLISRLESAEQSRLAPPMPPVSQAARLAAKARAQRSRSFAATAPAPAQPKAGGTTSTENVVSTASDISSPQADAPPAKELTPEQRTTAPGLPLDNAPASPGEFNIRFPSAQVVPEREQIIPSLPHKFGSSTSTSPGADSSSSGPKVVTVASAATHPQGGPVHGDAAVTDADALERQTADKIAEVEDKARANELYTLAGLSQPFTLDSLPDMAIPLPPAEEAAGEYKASSRPLNEEERVGAWVLAGAVGVVAALGWGVGRKDKKDAEKKGEKGDTKEGGKGEAMKEKKEGK